MIAPENESFAAEQAALEAMVTAAINRGLIGAAAVVTRDTLLGSFRNLNGKEFQPDSLISLVHLYKLILAKNFPVMFPPYLYRIAGQPERQSIDNGAQPLNNYLAEIAGLINICLRTGTAPHLMGPKALSGEFSVPGSVVCGRIIAAFKGSGWTFSEHTAIANIGKAAYTSYLSPTRD